LPHASAATPAAGVAAAAAFFDIAALSLRHLDSRGSTVKDR